MMSDLNLTPRFPKPLFFVKSESCIFLFSVEIHLMTRMMIIPLQAINESSTSSCEASDDDSCIYELRRAAGLGIFSTTRCICVLRGFCDPSPVSSGMQHVAHHHSCSHHEHDDDDSDVSLNHCNIWSLGFSSPSFSSPFSFSIIRV